MQRWDFVKKRHLKIKLHYNLLLVFSACGGIRTGMTMPVLTAYLGHLGKGWNVCGTTTNRLPNWASGLFYPSWSSSYFVPIYSLSVAVWPTAKH